MIFCPAAASPQETAQNATQISMRGMFVVLSSVYRYSLDANAFADPKNHDAILTSLDALAKNSEALSAHGGGLDPSFDFVKRSLSRDAHEALKSFKSANYVGSRFILSDITENCVTCHTKRPGEKPFEAGQQFLDDVDAKSFPAPARAKLQVAMRQFSEAMKTYEEILLSPKVTSDDLTVYDVFDNYLSVSIGAMNDAKRPVPTLEKFARRADMPNAAKADAQAWIASLKTLNLGVPKGEELATARRMMAGAEATATPSSDRPRLVDFIASITLLHRYLRSNPSDNTSVAEAYYLLGVAESHVSRSYWVSETNYLLEKSIRLAPKSKVAKQALAYLEEYRRSQSSVTPFLPVPPDTLTSIAELRKLTEQ
jgi:hypothetical protein